MLKRDIRSHRSAIGIRLAKFGRALKAGPFFLARADQLIFLCGANTAPGHPSPRRTALKRFIEDISSLYHVVYAEGVFTELTKIAQNRKNVLDLEHEISRIADKIVIVLESPSAFCELGAFAHPALRDKLVVVNDTRFQMETSFINTGPLAALVECESPVLWYPMSSNSASKVDGIGAVFAQLEQALYPKTVSGRIRVDQDLAKLEANKLSLYFVHDLVLFTGPVTHDELVSVLMQLFGDRSFDMLKRLLGVLRSANLILSRKVEDVWVYRALKDEPYLQYTCDASSLTAAFRLNHLKHNSRRLLPHG